MVKARPMQSSGAVGKAEATARPNVPAAATGADAVGEYADSAGDGSVGGGGACGAGGVVGECPPVAASSVGAAAGGDVGGGSAGASVARAASHSSRSAAVCDGKPAKAEGGGSEEEGSDDGSPATSPLRTPASLELLAPCALLDSAAGSAARLAASMDRFFSRHPSDGLYTTPVLAASVTG